MRLRPGVLDPNLYLYVEEPSGVGGGRLTYVRLEGKTVTAFVVFAPCEPIEGMPCFAIGYAVPERIAIRTLKGDCQSGPSRDAAWIRANVPSVLCGSNRWG